ncbi:hypothetical protein JTB14_000862 [Gonioctena quinquepunctata]|nr:hypothetical protein JTB14_000862 [Gonioctena quinquepunctata]
MKKKITLFTETGSPKYLWGEAIICAAYPLNRSPTSALVAYLHSGKQAIDTRCVITIKQDGTRKARLVAKCFQTEPSYEVYSPEVKHATIKMLIAHALQEKWENRQLDIPTVYLNGDLDLDI